MTPFKFKIITPSSVLFDGTTENVIVRTTVGDKGILANHEPYAAALPIGKLRMANADGKFDIAAVSAGSIKVDKGGDTFVLVQSCEWKDDIDVKAVEAEKASLEKKLEQSDISSAERNVAEYRLKLAKNRLSVALGESQED